MTNARRPSDERSLETRGTVGVLFDREVLKLLTVVVGWWMLETGAAMPAFVEFRGLLNALYEGVGALTALVGAVLYDGGALALLVKLVHDAAVLADLS
ncbi:hypothetical protein [Natronococcus sp.]|uniref:hypothetical protein n=1 Tax=Natronococcus sp. TaxID=35747 RepID=UPI0026014B66|nr:hypothetical protein [Natronococcus sp.]